MAKKKKASNNHLFLTILLFALVIVAVALFIEPASSLAQTYYNSINCPTPEPGKPVLQLIPCTPAGAANSPTYTPQTQSQQPPASTNAPTAPKTSTGTQSGRVCTPDSTVAPGASCKCQSDLEPDAVCTVASAQVCIENGGLNNPIAFAGLGGALNRDLLNKSITSSPNGPVQCMWLDTAPVPAAAHATDCTIECNSKPVLYFYSPTSLNVNVSLDIPGYITESIPTYPKEGWQNVIVHPQGTVDGTLLYKNQTYKELYYEDATIKATPPQEGFVIKTANLKSDLRTYTTKLGLNVSEQQEFLDYWVPRLTQLNAPYIFFTVFDQTQKEKVDHVIVSPAPQTTIAFLAYFKPLQNPIQVNPLQFQPIPKRQGFTLVEWGGTVETN